MNTVILQPNFVYTTFDDFYKKENSASRGKAHTKPQEDTVQAL